MESPPPPSYSALQRLIIVFGATGVGKSSFINAALGTSLDVGHSLYSCTQTLQVASGKIGGVDFSMVDSPGFDDTHRPEAEQLEAICNWLAQAKTNEMKIIGVIYLHRITDPRMGGVARKILRLFRKICGQEAESHVILCTTHWDEVELKSGEQREQTLRDDFWKPMLANGSTLERHDNTPACARRLVARMLKREGIDLKVQEEMVDEKKSFQETSAGKEMRGEIERLIARHEKEMAELKAEMQAAHRSEIAEIRAEMAEARRQLDARTQELNELMDKEKSRQEAEKQRMVWEMLLALATSRPCMH